MLVIVSDPLKFEQPHCTVCYCSGALFPHHLHVHWIVLEHSGLPIRVRHTCVVLPKKQGVGHCLVPLAPCKLVVCTSAASMPQSMPAMQGLSSSCLTVRAYGVYGVPMAWGLLQLPQVRVRRQHCNDDPPHLYLPTVDLWLLQDLDVFGPLFLNMGCAHP